MTEVTLNDEEHFYNDEESTVIRQFLHELGCNFTSPSSFHESLRRTDITQLIATVIDMALHQEDANFNELECVSRGLVFAVMIKTYQLDIDANKQWADKVYGNASERRDMNTYQSHILKCKEAIQAYVDQMEREPPSQLRFSQSSLKSVYEKSCQKIDRMDEQGNLFWHELKSYFGTEVFGLSQEEASERLRARRIRFMETGRTFSLQDSANLSPSDFRSSELEDFSDTELLNAVNKEAPERIISVDDDAVKQPDPPIVTLTPVKRVFPDVTPTGTSLREIKRRISDVNLNNRESAVDNNLSPLYADGNEVFGLDTNIKGLSEVNVDVPNNPVLHGNGEVGPDGNIKELGEVNLDMPNNLVLYGNGEFGPDSNIGRLDEIVLSLPSSPILHGNEELRSNNDIEGLREVDLFIPDSQILQDNILPRWLPSEAPNKTSPLQAPRNIEDARVEVQITEAETVPTFQQMPLIDNNQIEYPSQPMVDNMIGQPDEAVDEDPSSTSAIKAFTKIIRKIGETNIRANKLPRTLAVRRKGQRRAERRNFKEAVAHIGKEDPVHPQRLDASVLPDAEAHVASLNDRLPKAAEESGQGIPLVGVKSNNGLSAGYGGNNEQPASYRSSYEQPADGSPQTQPVFEQPANSDSIEDDFTEFLNANIRATNGLYDRFANLSMDEQVRSSGNQSGASEIGVDINRPDNRPQTEGKQQYDDDYTLPEIYKQSKLVNYHNRPKFDPRNGLDAIDSLTNAIWKYMSDTNIASQPIGECYKMLPFTESSHQFTEKDLFYAMIMSDNKHIKMYQETASYECDILILCEPNPEGKPSD